MLVTGLGTRTPDRQKRQSLRLPDATPPQSGIDLTKYMQNGAFVSLVAAVRRHINPAQYYGQDLRPDIDISLIRNSAIGAELLKRISPIIKETSSLTGREIDRIQILLHSLTDLRAQVSELSKLTPATVPQRTGSILHTAEASGEQD